MLIVASFALVSVFPSKLSGQDTRETWTWEDIAGKRRSRADLEKIIQSHALWISSKGKEGQKASFYDCDLSGVDLTGVNLSGADLFNSHFSGAKLSNAHLSSTDLGSARLGGADLSGANLRNANLSKAGLYKANLSGADLHNANLFGTNLQYANLLGADLREVELGEADLQGANLGGADLRNANLHRADFTNAKLYDTDLSGTDFSNVILGAARFEPKLPPPAETLVGVDLSKLYYIRSPHVLTLLRADLKSKGLREQERIVTYVIHHWRRRWAQCADKDWDPSKNENCPEPRWNTEAALNYILFEVTSGYGRYPGYPLFVAFTLIPVFGIVYIVTIAGSLGKRSGIWKVWSDENRVHKESDHKMPRRLSKEWYHPVCWLWGLWFSTLSAFHIGWRDLNVGSWLMRMSPGEYTLRATGAAKVVSGFQSVISIYLVALSILTYFGRPFE